MSGPPPRDDRRDPYGASRMPLPPRDRSDDRRDPYPSSRPDSRDVSRDYGGARDYRDAPPRDTYAPRDSSYGAPPRDSAYASRDPYDRPPPRDYDRQESRGMRGGYSAGGPDRDYAGPRSRPPMRRADSPNGRAPPPSRSLERRPPPRDDRRDSDGPRRPSRDMSPPPFKRSRPDGPPPRDRSPIDRRPPPGEYRGRPEGSPRGRGGYERRGTGERGRAPMRR